MALRVENSTCQLASILHCPRGTCWATIGPMRLLCADCYRTTFGSDPE